MTSKIIIVLSGGINKNSSLPLYVRQRLDLACRLFKNGKGMAIILSGRGTKRKQQIPKYTEAKIMRNYLVKKKVPKNKIFLEEKSYDTIGNAYFTRNLYLEPKKWYNVIVITSHFHLARTKKIFQWVFGKKYKIKFLAASDKDLNKEKINKRKKVEKILLNFLNKKIIPRFKTGNIKTIEKYIFKEHPVYCGKFDKKHLELENKVKNIKALY